MKATHSIEEYKIFKTEYEEISGLHLPFEYLVKSEVYVFKSKKQIIGGFVLGKHLP